jgi:toxin YoeB
MGKYSIITEKKAQKELQQLHQSGKKIDIKRVEQIIKELAEHPKTGIGKPEHLKYQQEEEIWSREINKKDRIIYQIIEREALIIIFSALGHYADK